MFKFNFNYNLERNQGNFTILEQSIEVYDKYSGHALSTAPKDHGWSILSIGCPAIEESASALYLRGTYHHRDNDTVHFYCMPIEEAYGLYSALKSIE